MVLNHEIHGKMICMFWFRLYFVVVCISLPDSLVVDTKLMGVFAVVVISPMIEVVEAVVDEVNEVCEFVTIRTDNVEDCSKCRRRLIFRRFLKSLYDF